MNGGLSAEVDYGAAISPVDCANIVRSGRSTRDGHERGRDKLSDKALRRAAGSRERPTSNRCLGLSGRRRPRWEWFEHMHVLALAYWHHMHAARLFLAFIHGCPLRAMSGRSIIDTHRPILHSVFNSSTSLDQLLPKPRDNYWPAIKSAQAASIRKTPIA